MKLNKILAASSVAILALNLAACSGAGAGETTPTPTVKAINCHKYSTSLMALDTEVTLNSQWAVTLAMLINDLQSDGLMEPVKTGDGKFKIHKFLETDFAQQCLSADTYDYFDFVVTSG